MIRGTTPTYTLTIPDYDLSDKTVFVTLAQGIRKITLSNDRVEILSDETGSTIVFELTQPETFAFVSGSASIQVRFIDVDGEAYATEIGSVNVNPVLLEREIKYAAD